MSSDPEAFEEFKARPSKHKRPQATKEYPTEDKPGKAGKETPDGVVKLSKTQEKKQRRKQRLQAMRLEKKNAKKLARIEKMNMATDTTGSYPT